MTQEKKKICPVCRGKKVVEGTCECNAEWRGTQKGDDWEECRCSPEQQCGACQGTGYVNSEE